MADVAISDLEKVAEQIRLRILKIGASAPKPAHYGGALSIVEILTALYFCVMNHNPADPCWKERDRFILSKGHGFLGLLATLNQCGYFSDRKASSFQSNGSDFIAHPVKKISLGVEASTGSLGQGISYAVGLAEALKRKGSRSRVFTLVGDGECDEGSVVEAVRLACARRLNNIVIIVDQNNFQNDGSTDAISGSVNLSSLFSSLGANVKKVDGHCMLSVVEALMDEADTASVIVAKTLKGKGVPFMESDNNWHHNTLSVNQIKQLNIL